MEMKAEQNNPLRNIENLDLLNGVGENQNIKMQDSLPVPAPNITSNNSCCTPTALLVITVVLCVIVIFIESVALAYIHATYSNRKEIEIQLAEQKILSEATVNATNLARCLQDVIDLEGKLNNTGACPTKPIDDEHSTVTATAVELSFMEDYKKCLARNTTDSNEIKRLKEQIGTMTSQKKDLDEKYKQCTVNMEKMAREQSRAVMQDTKDLKLKNWELEDDEDWN